MKLTNQQLLTLFSAHQGLDAGYARVVKEGDREKVVQEPFEFAPNVTFALAVNINRLTEALKPYNKANNALVKSHTPPGQVLHSVNTPGPFMAYSEAHEILLEQSVNVDLTTFTREEFELAKNRKILMNTLAGMLAIMPSESGPSAGTS